MNKTILLLVVAMFSVTLYTTNAQAKLTDEEDRFIQTITKDFEDTHSIKLNGYNFFDITEIDLDKDDLTSQEKSLLNIFIGIA